MRGKAYPGPELAGAKGPERDECLGFRAGPRRQGPGSKRAIWEPDPEPGPEGLAQVLLPPRDQRPTVTTAPFSNALMVTHSFPWAYSMAAGCGSSTTGCGAPLTSFDTRSRKSSVT